MRAPTPEEVPVAGDERSRLHEIIDGLADEELTVARQLLELLARGLANPPHPVSSSAGGANGIDEDDDEADDDDDLATSPETLAKLAQLTDEELVHLDGLLASDRAAAQQFWRDRFGEDLPDDELVEDGNR